MKWRCEQCGKPHERNDPPCDNCGHHKFERAVVPVAPEDPDREPSPVWVCPECGREHQKHSPPCSRCGNPTLEKRTPDADHLDADPTEAPTNGGSDTDVAADVEHVPSAVWVCPECGREHQKNTPPCSRCGHATLEREVPDYADLDEIGSTSYLDLLSARYLAALAVALLAGAVLLLAVMGVITLPGMGPSLDVQNVPGQADEANGLDLETSEGEYVAAMNDRRTDGGVEELTRDEDVGEVAQYYNQRRVKAIHGDGEQADDEVLGEALGRACDDRPQLASYRVATTADGPQYDSESAFAAALIDPLFSNFDGFDEIESGRTGVDVHVAPDGSAYVTAIAC